VRVPRLAPLVININGSLVRNDSLVEALVVTVLRKPAATVAIIRALLRGRPALKTYLAELKVHDPNMLPLRQDVVQLLREEKSIGRELHLATASDKSVADSVAARVGLFSSVEGTRDGMNLKGRPKLQRLQERFPDGFAYVVNDLRDRHVWHAASSLILVGASSRTRRAALRLGLPIEREIPNKRATLLQWLVAIRMHQWSKNLLLFVPLLLAHRYGDARAFLQVMLGFLSLCFVASSTYLINDLSDIDADRAHSTKCERPIARADIAPGAALMAAIGLLGAGLAAAIYLGSNFFALIVLYLAMSLSYSLHLKRVPIFDVFLLGCLYTLRVFMGAVLLTIPASSWLLVFSLFFFFSMSMAKRHVEIVNAAKTEAPDDLIKGRGYMSSDAQLTLTLGVSSTLAAILILFLYIVNDAAPVGAYRHPQWLWLISIVVFLWTCRVWLLSHRGELNDDPVAFAGKDPLSWLLAAIVSAMFVLAVL
jgi:4-hydroxybenzoate polyprenyltransferase